MPERLLTTDEVAARLGIDPSRVRRMASQYGVGVKFGVRAWAFTESDVSVLTSHSTGKRGRPPKS